MNALLHLIRCDVQENALVALKIIVDLQKAFKGELEGYVL